MDRKIFILIAVILALIATFVVLHFVTEKGKAERDKANAAVEKALDQSDPNNDPHRPKDKGYGSELKKRAYDNSKKAYEAPDNRLDKYEKNLDDPGGGGGP